MKRFFASRPKQPAPTTQQNQHQHQQSMVHLPTLVPKLTVPPIPHPCPYDRILVLATHSGLLLRAEGSDPSSCMRISWEKEVVIEQVEGSNELDWENSLGVLGIVGILQLFTTSYILVITSRKECGHLLDPTHHIYNIKSVASIPLNYNRASKAIQTILSLQAPRPNLKPSNTLDTVADPSLPKVHFATDGTLTPSTTGTTTPTASDAGIGEDEEGQEIPVKTPSPSETAAIAKTIASRLSFWSKITLPKRQTTDSASLSETADIQDTAVLNEAQATINDEAEPITPTPTLAHNSDPNATESTSPSFLSTVPLPGLESDPSLVSMINSNVASAPITPAERHSELEDKIIRECVKEFSKGSMYFSYTFDITRSLQHKHESLTKANKTRHLLSDLDVITPPLATSEAKTGSPKPNSPPTTPHTSSSHTKSPPTNPKSPLPPSQRPTPELRAHSPEGEPNFLAEPSPMLPLWRRVDRQFWWNEWLARPFVEAGLHSYVLPIMQGYCQIASFDVPDAQADFTPLPTATALPASRTSEIAANNSSPSDVASSEKPNIVTAAHVQAGDFTTAAAPTNSFITSGDILTTSNLASPAAAKVMYAIISRRSRDRAGLRYQRRGIDDEARVANFVETETVVGIEREGRSNVFAYVQIRGSIPLFWTQVGSGLKPAPQLAQDRTHDQNLDAVKRHFRRTVDSYGPHTIVNLAEQQGKEAAVTHAYKDYVNEMHDNNVKYHEYDFHTETKGMKYENISKLISFMERTFDSQGYLWVSGNTLMSEQKGVFRVNCIDCLDRTNVVQSAFARYVLNKQLGAVALLNPSLEGKAEADVVFNDVWANNGDAISRAYAGTSALKGDFTRTGKRDLSGLLNDGVNSLARMYTSTFSDWFSQAVIDFTLGNRSLSVFSEFLLKLQSSDPRDLIRLSKIRAEAIATSVSRVLEEGESLLSGWTLFAPTELNTKMGDKWEEKVLLLTVRALYIISYDYTLQKVKLYTRVPLGDILNITKGAFIISPLEEASRDPRQNAGFVINFTLSRHVTRTTSYSVRNSLESPPASPPVSRMSFPTAASLAKSLSRKNMYSSSPTAAFVGPSGNRPKPQHRPLSLVADMAASQTIAAKIASDATTAFAAFKVLPIDPTRIRASSSGGGSALIMTEPSDDLAVAANCQEAVDMIVESIMLACRDVGSAHTDGFVKDEDVVSLAEAQRLTSVYAKMEYGVKRLLWLGG